MVAMAQVVTTVQVHQGRCQNVRDSIARIWFTSQLRPTYKFYVVWYRESSDDVDARERIFAGIPDGISIQMSRRVVYKDRRKIDFNDQSFEPAAALI